MRTGPLKTTSYMLRDGLRIVFRRIPSGTHHRFFGKRFFHASNLKFGSWPRLGTEEERLGAVGQSPAPGEQNSVTAVVKEKIKNSKTVFRRNGGGYRMGFDKKLS